MIMLTSRGLRGEVCKMKEIGFDAYLTKPIRRSQLFDAIVRVFSGEPREIQPSEQPVTKYSSRDMKAKDTRVLGVEDHPVNQKIIQRILEKLGFRHQVAGDGRKALEALAEDHYDIVLMDVQMPVMDGYECALRIRSQDSD